MVEIKKTKVIISMMILMMAFIIGIIGIGVATPVQPKDNVPEQIIGAGDVTPVQPKDNVPPDQTGSITKLEIIPQYGNIRLQPGESKEIIVTVRNRDEKSVSINTNIGIMNGYIDIGWITVTPTKTEIPVGESKKFTIKVSVPKDASIGGSSIQIAFADGILPKPYSEPIIPPIYNNAFQLSVDIWTPPKLQIMMPYINGQFEAGNKYDYEIKVKNIGDKEIGINPKLGNDMYYGPYPIPILADKYITIKAPNSIRAGEIETIKIHIDVPKDTRGYYNNYIDLGADDPSIREGDARISLSFNIWVQPTEPFIKKFSLDKKSDITVEITSNNYYNLPMPIGEWKEPSFETNLVGPEGEAGLQLTKTIMKGNVNMGSDKPILETDSNSAYQEMGGQYIFTYKTAGSIGEWKLKVLPKNVPGFDYSIIIGDNK